MKAGTQKKQVLQPIEPLTHVLRGQKIMIDEDLARLYGVGTKVLNQAVKRNIDRFPEDFMFQLTTQETAIMRSQIVTTSKRRLNYQQFAFTEHGVAMLSSVLRSPRAVQMNIMIIRAFVRMRELIAANKDLAVRIEKLENSHERTDSVIEVLVEDIDRLSKEIHWIKNLPIKPKHRMGFYVEKGDQK